MRNRPDSKKFQLLIQMYKYRGITCEQLFYSLEPSEMDEGYSYTNPIKPSVRNPLKTVRKHLNDLEDNGLVEHISFGKRTNLYFLTKEGLEKVKNLLDIPLDHIGLGFNQDYGDFDYDRYKPPLSRLEHHLLLIDFLLHCERLRAITPNLSLDYRDNRYAHVQYTAKKNELFSESIKEGNSHFRPDAEIILDGKRYYVEIDTASERSEHLRKKFEGYHRFLSTTTDHPSSLPNGIIFVSEAKQRGDYGLRRRWQTLSNAFYEHLGEYSPIINLKSTSITEVEQILLNESAVQKETRFNNFKNLIKYYFVDGFYVGTQMLSVDSTRGWKYGNAYFNFNQSQEHPHIYLYLDCCGIESIPATHIREFKKWLNEQNDATEILKTAKEVVPVFTFAYGTPYIHHLPEIQNELTNALWMDISSDRPVWYNAKGEKLQVRNPILYRLEQIQNSK